jgi:hypothetical protein
MLYGADGKIPTVPKSSSFLLIGLGLADWQVWGESLKNKKEGDTCR